MKRKLKWMGAVLAVLLVGMGTALFLWPRDRITPTSWKEIRIGMTEREVKDILGGPGISWVDFLSQIEVWEKSGNLPNEDGNDLLEPKQPISGIGSKIWIGRRGYMEIVFDRGQVYGKFFYGWKSGNPNFIDLLHDWLGW